MKSRQKKYPSKQDVEQVINQVKGYANTPGHRMPRSRREFLTSGLLGLATYSTLPALSTLLGQRAFADPLDCDQSTDLPVYINLQLAGGPAMFAQHLAHGENGEPLSGYGILGVGNGPAIEHYFKNNAPFYAPDAVRPGSGMLKGLKERMGPTLFKEIIGGKSAESAGKAIFIAVACKSIDDKFDNKHDLSGILAKAGLGGGALPYLLYESTSASPVPVDLGSNRFKPAFYTAPSYLLAASREAIESALGFKGVLLSQLKAPTADPIALQSQLVSAIHSLSQHQAQKILRDPGSSEAEKLFYRTAQCASAKSKQVLTAQQSINLDIFADPTLANIWKKDFVDGAFPASFKNEANGMIGVSVAAALRGISSSCTAVLGGYDYHFGAGQRTTRADSDDKDVYAGKIIANILMTAHTLGKKVFLYISADGSVSTPVNPATPHTVDWVGDYPERGMNYIIAYDPKGEVEAKAYSGKNYKDAAFQLNHFAKNSAEDLVVGLKNPIAGTDAQELAAGAVFLNYLSFAKRREILNHPELTVLKNRLNDSLPGSEPDVFNFYSRIAG